MLTGLFFLFCAVLAYQSGKTTVSLAIRSDTAGILQIFWRLPSEDYSEKKAVSVKIEPGVHRYELKIPSLLGFSFLRIDPLDKPGRMVIKKLVFSQSFYHPTPYDFQSLPHRKDEASGLADLSYAPEAGFSFASTGNDPWFIVHPEIRYNFNTIFLWLLSSPIAGSILFVLLNQRILRGKKSDGLLWLEDSGDAPADVLSSIASLRWQLAGLTLIEATEDVTRRNYRFSFANAEPRDFQPFMSEIRRDYPHVHIRIQFHRSGEI